MISKSSFIKFYNCKKAFWLNLNCPNEAEQLSTIALDNIENGKEVFELAKQYFSDTFDCLKMKEGFSNTSEQVEFTKLAMQENHNAVAKATFVSEFAYCIVDILKKDETGYSIYRVKGSKKLKSNYYIDIAFQKYVLEKCGVKINHMYIMYINKDYIFDGTLNLDEFFKIECVDENEIANECLSKIDDIVNEILTFSNDKQEPETIYCSNCKNCEFYKYCSKNIPSDNIESLYGIGSNAYKFYNKNIFTISDYIKTSEYEQSKKVLRREKQIEFSINNITEPYIDKEKIVEFLDKIKYPIYYLDFEMASNTIPKFNGFKPFERYPFQYSLHIEYENGKVEHKEFLGENEYCLRELSEQLINDIPKDSQLIIYDATSEIDCIKYLAEKFNDLSEHLLSLTNDYIDLLEPFRNMYYFQIKQGGSNSIKYVLPAICPEMENYYNDLPSVHNGCEALTTFRELINKKGTEEYEKIKNDMLKYCELDTFSMVKILSKLRELVK